jgi:hypothetical protein
MASTQTHTHHTPAADNNDLSQATFPSTSNRTWGEFLRQKGRELGLGATMAASSLGLAGVMEKEGRGDMILTFSALEARKAEGAANTVSGGGNGMYMGFTRPDGSLIGHASAFGFNYGGVGHIYTAGHTVYNNLSLNPNFYFGTGSNFNTSPGDIYTPVFMRIAPGYAGQSTIGSAMDITYFRLATEIAGAGTISFPTTTLNTTGNVNLVSFGELAVYGDSSYGQTGDAYGGRARISTLGTLFGANPDLYQRVNFSPGDVESTKAMNGSSGGLVHQDLLALGLATQAQTSVSSLGYQYVRFDSPEFRTFHAENMAAVPEPSSLVTLGSLAAAGLAWRVIRRSRADTSKS